MDYLAVALGVWAEIEARKRPKREEGYEQTNKTNKPPPAWPVLAAMRWGDPPAGDEEPGIEIPAPPGWPGRA